jgi:hypothetical protein
MKPYLDDKPYEGLNFSRKELSSIMKEYYEDIITFITQPVFQTLFSEMMSLKPNERPAYVNDVWINPTELEKRGLQVPKGILIQTSAFGDRRPTLFVVKKFLPEKYHKAWENVNWTFNNDFQEEDVPSDPENSWRLPLSVSVQNALISNNINLQSVEDDSDMLTQQLFGNEIVKSERQVI